MDQLRSQLPFCSKFYGCKFLEMLYLFVSPICQSERMVMLTEKTDSLCIAIANCRLPIAMSERFLCWTSAIGNRQLALVDSRRQRGV